VEKTGQRVWMRYYEREADPQWSLEVELGLGEGEVLGYIYHEASYLVRFSSVFAMVSTSLLMVFL
jgi:hypothetical protein